MLPPGEAPTIKSKYVQLGVNQFRNDYLRDVVSKMPHYNDYLRAHTGDGEVIGNKLEPVPDHVGREIVDLNEVFAAATQKAQFYEIIKKKYITEENEDNDQMQAYMRFYEECQNSGDKNVINARLVNFTGRAQYLYNHRIDVPQSLAIKKYLAWSVNYFPNRLREIVIDSCQMTDEVLENILAGVLAQRPGRIEEERACREGYKKPAGNFYTFVYQHNTLGRRGIEKLRELGKDLLELRLSRVELEQDCLPLIMDVLLEPGRAQFLMKLALTQMNLNDAAIVADLIDLMHVRKHLQYVDLSDNKLSPKLIHDLTSQFVLMKPQLRNINLSYNRLSFADPTSANYKHSDGAVTDLISLARDALILNHINFSGMGIARPQMMELCKALHASQLLMGVHLSDNGITSSIQYTLEILELFDLKLQDMPRRKVDQIDPRYVQKEAQDLERLYENQQQNDDRDRVDIRKNIQIYMRYEYNDAAENKSSKKDKDE